MADKQVFISANNWFSCEYSRMWESEIVEGIPVFFDPINGYGALQLISLTVGLPSHEMNEKEAKILEVFPFLKGANLQEKMKLFLSNQQIFKSLEDIPLHKMDDHLFVAEEYYIDSTFYMSVMKQKHNLFILGIYNCKDYPSKEEALEIGQIISSIKFLK